MIPVKSPPYPVYLSNRDTVKTALVSVCPISNGSLDREDIFESAILVTHRQRAKVTLVDGMGAKQAGFDLPSRNGYGPYYGVCRTIYDVSRTMHGICRTCVRCLRYCVRCLPYCVRCLPCCVRYLPYCYCVRYLLYAVFTVVYGVYRTGYCVYRNCVRCLRYCVRWCLPFRVYMCSTFWICKTGSSSRS